MKTDAILINAARDLRTKADNVVQALNHRIAIVDEARIRLENELAEVSVCPSSSYDFFILKNACHLLNIHNS